MCLCVVEFVSLSTSQIGSALEVLFYLEVHGFLLIWNLSFLTIIWYFKSVFCCSLGSGEMHHGLSTNAFLLFFDCSSLLGFLWEWRTWKSYRERQMEVLKVGHVASPFLKYPKMRDYLLISGNVLSTVSSLWYLCLLTKIFVALNPHCHHSVLLPLIFYVGRYITTVCNLLLLHGMRNWNYPMVKWTQIHFLHLVDKKSRLCVCLVLTLKLFLIWDNRELSTTWIISGCNLTQSRSICSIRQRKFSLWT